MGSRKDHKIKFSAIIFHFTLGVEGREQRVDEQTILLVASNGVGVDAWGAVLLESWKFAMIFFRDEEDLVKLMFDDCDKCTDSG